MQITNHAACLRNAPLPILVAAAALFMAGCSTPPPPPPQAKVDPPVMTLPPPAPLIAARPKPQHVSQAPNDRAYRHDAAKHLYSHNNQRIFQGKLPPLLYAVGVLEVDIDDLGLITELRWMRAPSHAPEVVAEIERAIRAAEPFPAPSHTGKVTYTDTWLWHKSGRFQLDTLTLGQL
jgi:periplasmic protein TonB